MQNLFKQIFYFVSKRAFNEHQLLNANSFFFFLFFSLSLSPFFASHIPPLHACASQRIQSNSLVRFDRVVKKPSNFSPDYPRTNFHTNYFPLERATKRVSVFGPATVTVPRSYTATGRNNRVSRSLVRETLPFEIGVDECRF